MKRIYILLNNNLNNRRKIRGNHNSIQAQEAILNRVDFDIQGNNNTIIIRRGTIINKTHFYIHGSNHKVDIGCNCRFTRGSTIWFEDNDCLLTIGDNTTIEEAHIAVTEPGSSIEIGKDCMLAYDVDIRCGDSHSIVDLSTGQRINYAKGIKIGDHVWLAAHVQVLKGVTIGPNSVLAIRSVVTKDVPSTSLAAGVPAEVVRASINWDRTRIYKS